MSILFPQLSTFFRPQATRMLISYSTSNPILFQSVRPVRPHKNVIIIYCNIHHHHHHLSVDSLLYCIFVSIYHLYTFLLQKKSHLNNLLSKRKLLSNLQICFDNNFSYIILPSILLSLIIHQFCHQHLSFLFDWKFSPVFSFDKNAFNLHCGRKDWRNNDFCFEILEIPLIIQVVSL